MSPRIEIYSTIPGGQTKRESIELPDLSGEYETPLGSTVLDMSKIDPSNEIQLLRIFDREVHLSPEGRGSEQVAPGVRVHIALHEPIRKPGEWVRVRRRKQGRRVMWIPKPQHNTF